VLKWARENGCPWDEQTCAHAAEGGHLEVLKWARENGCPWDESTCWYAAEGGHLELLRWARENGAPWDENTRRIAACEGIRRTLSRRRDRRERESHNAGRARRDETNDLIDT
jgi:hypothetical protein